MRSASTVKQRRPDAANRIRRHSPSTICKRRSLPLARDNGGPTQTCKSGRALGVWFEFGPGLGQKTCDTNQTTNTDYEKNSF